MRSGNARAFIFLFALVTGLPAAAQQPPSIAVSGGQEISVAQSLSHSISAMVTEVKVCVDRREAAPEQCYCRFPQALDLVRSRFHAAIALHPTWRPAIVNWTDPATKASYSLMMPAIARQIEAACPTTP